MSSNLVMVIFLISARFNFLLESLFWINYITFLNTCLQIAMQNYTWLSKLILKMHYKLNRNLFFPISSDYFNENSISRRWGLWRIWRQRLGKPLIEGCTIKHSSMSEDDVGQKEKSFQAKKKKKSSVTQVTDQENQSQYLGTKLYQKIKENDCI